MWLGVAVSHGFGGTSAKPKPATTEVLAPPRPFRVIFPEGFTRRQMAERVGAVAKIAQRERGARVRLSARSYLAATARPRRIPGFGRKRYPLEGFLFPAAYDFGRRTTSAQLAAQQLITFQAPVAHRQPRVRALEEPDALRRAHDRLDDREGGAGARGPGQDLGRDLQPAARAHAARDRRDDPLRAEHPAHEVDPAVAAGQQQPVQHAAAPRAAADADRESRAWRRSRRPRTRHTSTTSTSCASPTRCTTSSRRARARSTPTRRRTATDVSSAGGGQHATDGQVRSRPGRPGTQRPPPRGEPMRGNPRVSVAELC